MQSFLLKTKTKKSFLERLSSLKYSTRENYQASLHRFEQFCNSNYQGRTSENIIHELKSIKPEERDDAYFGLLQDFVNWLVSLGLSHATVNMYFQVVTYYFSYHGIRVHHIDIRQNVKRPKKIKEKLHVLTKEEIQRIFEFAPQKRKMLYLTLIGSGMRIRECVALRRKDFDLSFPKRIKIEIPAQFTKAQTAHSTFVSKEAARYLKPHLESLQYNDLVFATNHTPYHASMTEIEAFTRYRSRAGLTGQYESTGRHHISLHSFRSYFFTRARRVHDTDIAHAMVGHTTYLDMYDRKDDEEKLELYLTVESELRIN
ncbi:tyrosine-type recombinase/integrase [Candidatus Nitrosotenuis cloacae]|uniref:tyrosine-type recombinase/integrase n=1 Tax=Candidatus Nitrosotenuis cloacae TaxID=1603555 RepID=UPI00227EB6C2|nr:tyrosine-type recombinase/integrase [Candidatus Nitrosotenuis cloacae]